MKSNLCSEVGGRKKATSASLIVNISLAVLVALGIRVSPLALAAGQTREQKPPQPTAGADSRTQDAEAPDAARINGDRPRRVTDEARVAVAPSVKVISAAEIDKLYPRLAESYDVGPLDLTYIEARNLLLPVDGIRPAQLHDNFASARSGGRQHHALDIMAPGGSPVLAATEGRIFKLHSNRLGGITIYELDPTGLYVYYYAHLAGYADGLFEGKLVKRGEVIAYVGDTGNAGSGNFHLHFAISKLGPGNKWSGGVDIDPFPFLTKERLEPVREFHLSKPPPFDRK